MRIVRVGTHRSAAADEWVDRQMRAPRGISVALRNEQHVESADDVNTRRVMATLTTTLLLRRCATGPWAEERVRIAASPTFGFAPALLRIACACGRRGQSPRWRSPRCPTVISAAA
jgi:hypothetical protein